MTALLKRIKLEFLLRKWQPVKGDRTLFISQPNDQVLHRIFFSDPYPPRLLPSMELVGLRCTFQLILPAIENLLGRALNCEPDAVTLNMSLCHVCPYGSCYEDTYVHLIDPDALFGKYSIENLMTDYDKYLEPIRLKLSDMNVLAEKDYMPLGTGKWSWNSRRAAYYHLYGTSKDRVSYMDWLESEVDNYIATTAVPDSVNTKIFTSIEQLQQSNRDWEYKTVQRIKQLVGWIRDNN